MKKTLHLCLGILIITLSFAPVEAQKELTLNFEKSCNFDGRAIKKKKVYGFSSDTEAEQAVKKIVETIGLSANFKIQAASVENAVAVFDGEKRQILYSRVFMESLKAQAKTDWAAIGVLAHEIGHHLNGHTFESGEKRPDQELEADIFAGNVMAKMGANLEEALSAFKNLPEIESDTHPPKDARLEAVLEGWKKAGGGAMTRTDPVKPDPIKPDPPIETNNDKPTNWPSSLWGTCWKGSYIDFTEANWADLTVEQQIQYAKSYQEWYAKKQRKNVTEIYQKRGAIFNFVLIPPGKYIRGSPSTEEGRDADEGQVVDGVFEGMWVSETEITQAQWIAVMRNNPSHFKKGDNYPVEQVTWDESKEFCRQTGLNLLSESQWEYVCRGGTTSAYSYGQDERHLGIYAWYDANSGSSTQFVKKKLSNSWGLYDMHGNVWEWCEDLYPASSGRVRRGGGWGNSADRCRSASRRRGDPTGRWVDLGLRVSRSL